MRHHSFVRDGPELALESVVAANLNRIVKHPDPHWVAGSLRIGAGLPDILIAHWQPDVLALNGADREAVSILAFLRQVRQARVQTLSEGLRISEARVAKSLLNLEEVGAVDELLGSFRITAPWKTILPHVAAIEVKVSNWRSAVAQAARNSVLVHHSFVAFPEKLARRVAREDSVARLGLGVLAIVENDIAMLRRPRRSAPKVWQYYYQLAQVLAADICEVPGAVRRFN